MGTVIQVENLAKSFLIGHQSREPYFALRDIMVETVKNAGRRILHPMRAGSRGNSVEEIWALKDVSFEVKQGDRVGIIGRNGAGKSTLLKILSRITEPTRGRVRINGRVGSLLEVGTGFHPELTGRENIFLNGAILGMTKAEIKRKFDEIVDFAEIEKFLDTPVKRYSSGMYVRLAFSVAAHLDPEILIVDEVLAVGDYQFQEKCAGRMGEVGREGRTILFVTHNMGLMKNLCNRAILLAGGGKNFEGDVLEAVSIYRQEYNNNITIRKDVYAIYPSIPSASIIEIGLLCDGNPAGDDISTEHCIDIYVVFRVISPAKVGTTVLLYNGDGQIVFASISNHEPNWHGKTRPPGIYKSICEIPKNFLADGRYSVSIVFWEGHYNDVINLNNVLYFLAKERGLVRGDLPYEMKNVLTMPFFNWISIKLD
jgi:lipopolysaccharide transport system ATP-binding protein